MPAPSHALVEFAHHHRIPPAPGVEVIATPRYQITLRPDFPIPGPNSVSWIKCPPGQADDVIREVRATVAPRHLPLMWTLDPETEPTDFADHLAAHGVHSDPHGAEAAVMVLPIDATVAGPAIAGLAISDALADLGIFRKADAVAGEAFGTPSAGEDPERIAMLDRRRLNSLAAGNQHLLLAQLDGEPAGAGSLSLFANGAFINGGSVRPKFRGRGVYRALVAARLEIARRADASGLAVWGGSMSAPILSRLGFQTVSWRRFYRDESTA